MAPKKKLSGLGLTDNTSGSIHYVFVVVIALVAISKCNSSDKHKGEHPPSMLAAR